MNDEILDQELSALLDGELTPERAAELRQRIENEPEHSARFAELSAVNDSLRGLTPPAMPADLRARLQQRIDRDAPAPVERSSRMRAMGWGAPLAAALAAGLVAAWLMFPGSPTEEAQVVVEPPSTSAAEVVSEPALEEASDDELEIAFELETLRDLDMIQDLDLLEALAAIEDAEAQSNNNEERG